MPVAWWILAEILLYETAYERASESYYNVGSEKFLFICVQTAYYRIDGGASGIYVQVGKRLVQDEDVGQRCECRHCLGQPRVGRHESGHDEYSFVKRLFCKAFCLLARYYVFPSDGFHYPLDRQLCPGASQRCVELYVYVHRAGLSGDGSDAGIVGNAVGKPKMFVIRHYAVGYVVGTLHEIA